MTDQLDELLKENEILKNENEELKKNHIKKYVKLATRTEAPVGPILDRLKTNKVAFHNFINHLRYVVEALNELDKWKKYIMYGKDTAVNTDYKVKKSSGHELTSDNVTDLLDEKMVRTIHGVIGSATESSEMLEAILKYFDGNTFDEVNFIEEMADVNYYQNLLCDVYNTDEDLVSMKWVRKLMLRYPGKFTEDKAINRDLAAERKSLEG